MNEKIKRALTLFTTFFKIGAFTFGGGYAMIPLIQREVVENKKWITDDDILDIVAIAESTPGPIAINTATFVGYRVCGVLGSAAATFGTVLPSFVIILVISAILTQFQELEAVKFAFMGIRAGVLALIVKALIGMFKKCEKGIVPYIIMAGSFAAVAIFKFNTILVLICCALFGLATSMLVKKGDKNK